MKTFRILLWIYKFCLRARFSERAKVRTIVRNRNIGVGALAVLRHIGASPCPPRKKEGHRYCFANSCETSISFTILPSTTTVRDDSRVKRFRSLNAFPRISQLPREFQFYSCVSSYSAGRRTDKRTTQLDCCVSTRNDCRGNSRQI